MWALSFAAMALLHKCWDRVTPPSVLLFFWPYGSCILPCALAQTEEVTFDMSLLHGIFLSSGDLNASPGVYQADWSSECLSSSSPIPLFREGDQGQRSSRTSLINGPGPAFLSPLPFSFIHPHGKGTLRLDHAVGEACAGRLDLPRELRSRGCFGGVSRLLPGAWLLAWFLQGGG